VSETGFHLKNFREIYVEQRAFDYPMTKEILKHFPKSRIITIDHYKDVFNRPGQDTNLQSKAKSLILAVNTGEKLFEASRVCQDFGMGDFYYAESAMNCPFSCDYCFLKGMYATGNVVVFVNSEDYLEELRGILKKGPMYLCVSFDTDLCALSGFAPWKEVWEDFALVNPNLTIEIRTKATVNNFRASPNIIYAFTLSPREVIKQYERGSASLDARIKCINRLLDAGARVRLCFDPVVYVKNWRVCYNNFIDEVTDLIDVRRVGDISAGTFRISSDYLGNLRKASPGSAAVLYPFIRQDGFCVYPDKLRTEMMDLITSKLKEAGYGSEIYIND